MVAGYVMSNLINEEQVDVIMKAAPIDKGQRAKNFTAHTVCNYITQRAKQNATETPMMPMPTPVAGKLEHYGDILRQIPAVELVIQRILSKNHVTLQFSRAQGFNYYKLLFEGEQRVR